MSIPSAVIQFRPKGSEVSAATIWRYIPVSMFADPIIPFKWRVLMVYASLAGHDGWATLTCDEVCRLLGEADPDGTVNPTSNLC